MPHTPDLLTQIHQRQQRRLPLINNPLPSHEPEMLYIGCIDARLDPIEDIGIPKGRALIYRNIGALVPPPHPLHEGLPPESESVGATLEFFLKHIKSNEDRTKHIVVSGHTHCGGVHYACEHHLKPEGGDWFLPRYLSLLTGAVHKIFGGGEPDVKNDDSMRKVEQESVCQSIDNLMKYKVVQEAMAEHKLELHGWVIDTQTQCIDEMQWENGHPTSTFEPMNKSLRPKTGQGI